MTFDVNIMIRENFLKPGCLLAIALCLVTLSLPNAEAIILHPETEPDLLVWTEKPHNDVVGRWGSNASCVVVAASYIITTRHQGGGTSTPVTIGGVPYTINKIITHPTADLRLVKLNNAHLTEYAFINGDPNEVNQVAVLGGYGDGRAEPPLKAFSASGTFCCYGYLWDNSANTTQRWGTNEIAATSHVTEGYSSELIVSQFDAPLTTDYECSVGDHDSGGGWFLPTSKGWKVIGLSRSTATYSPFQSRFLNLYAMSTPIPAYPNPMSMDSIECNHLDAVRISPYADWILENMHASEMQNLALQWLCTGCNEANNFCDNADMSRDGNVNMKDFVILAEQWPKR